MSRGASRSQGATGSPWQADISQLFRRRRGSSGIDVLTRPPFVPTLPQVDLLPASVRDAIRRARVRRYFVLVAVLIVVASAGVWFLQSDRIAIAERAVADATATNESVRRDLEALAPVRQMDEQISQLTDVVTQTLAAQPRAAAVVERILQAGRAAGGRAVSFSTIDVVYGGIPQPGSTLNDCPNPDPFKATITIGCATFSATMESRDDVATMLRLLEADPLFVGPYVTTSTATTIEGEGDVVSFTGSAGVSTEGLETPLTQEQIDAILAPPEASAEASAPGATPAPGPEQAVDEAAAP